MIETVLLKYNMHKICCQVSEQQKVNQHRKGQHKNKICLTAGVGSGFNFIQVLSDSTTVIKEKLTSHI